MAANYIVALPLLEKCCTFSAISWKPLSIEVALP